MLFLVDIFLEQLGARVQLMEALRESASLAELRAVAHQLKGAAGGYGFMPITVAAAGFEQLPLDAPTEQQHAALGHLLLVCNAALRGRETISA